MMELNARVSEQEEVLPPNGISFEFEGGEGRGIGPALKQAVRRMHVDLGHPANGDLTRYVSRGPEVQRVCEVVPTEAAEAVSAEGRGP